MGKTYILTISHHVLLRGWNILWHSTKTSCVGDIAADILWPEVTWTYFEPILIRHPIWEKSTCRCFWLWLLMLLRLLSDTSQPVWALGSQGEKYPARVCLGFCHKPHQIKVCEFYFSRRLSHCWLGQLWLKSEIPIENAFRLYLKCSCATKGMKDDKWSLMTSERHQNPN